MNRRERKERRLKIENWKEQNSGWYNVYKGTKRALRQYPVKVDVKVNIDWSDITLGVMLGALPYALMFLYILER